MISDNNLIIKVQDTGTGISTKVISKIFDPFFTTKDVNKGTGLGLTISYSIIQKHGGRLTVESEQGKGSVFTIHLPLKTNQKYLSRCIEE
jgi:signal transduction histidine kinase